MGTFHFEGVTNDGVSTQGKRHGLNAATLQQELRAEGITVYLIQEVESIDSPSHARRLNWDDLNVLSEELQAMAASNLPLAPTLQALARDTQRGRLREMLDRLHPKLDQGKPLSAALREEGSRIPPAFLHLVTAAEHTGNPSRLFQLLGSYTRQMLVFEHAIKSSLLYPIMLVAGTGVLFLFLLFVVLPEFAAAFEGIDRETGNKFPAITQFYLDLSDILQAHWIAAVILLAGGLFLFAMFWHLLRTRPRLRPFYERIAFALPWAGHVRYLAVLARFSRTLSLLLQAGVPAIPAVDLAAAASGSALLRRKTQPALAAMNDGAALGESLAATHFFGHDFCWFLGTGELRGHPEEALETIADKCERDLRLRQQMLGAMATPIAVLVVGALVASLLLAMWWPMLNVIGGAGGRMQ